MSAKDHVRFLAALAERCGWRTEPGTQGGVVFTAPDHTNFVLPDGSIRSTIFDQKVRTIGKHGKFECVAAINADVLDELLSMHRIDSGSRRQVYRLIGLPERPSREPRTISQPVLSKEDADWAKRQLETAPTPPPVPEEYDIVDAHPGKRAAPEAPAGRHVVFVGPRDANKGSGHIYASHAVLERRWSDGTVDFACSWTGCDYTHAKHTSVSAHYRAHVYGKGETPRPDPYRIDPDLAEQSRRESRIRRLAADLAEADKALDENWEWHELAQWVIDKQERERGEAPTETEARELTAEEVVARIAVLVDRGRVSELMAANQAAVERAEAAEAEAARLRDERSALRDLLADDVSAPARITVT